LKTVVQLVVDEDVGIVTDDLPFVRCGKCGRVKYLPVARGPFPGLEREPSRAMAKTHETFGSGGSAFHGVLVSQRLGKLLRDRNVRGASLRPVARRG
jgi:hypothetical protein